MAQQKKRHFIDLRSLILENIATGQKTLNQISSETGINWKTVDNHITFLIGKGLAREVFSSRYVRIVEATEKGMEAAQKNSAGASKLSNAPKASKMKQAKFEKIGEVRLK